MWDVTPWLWGSPQCRGISPSKELGDFVGWGDEHWAAGARFGTSRLPKQQAQVSKDLADIWWIPPSDPFTFAP